MAEIHLLKEKRNHDAALCDALRDIISTIEKGEIITLCVAGLCTGKEGMFTMTPPTADVDWIKLLGAVRVLEMRLMDRIQE